MLASRKKVPANDMAAALRLLPATRRCLIAIAAFAAISNIVIFYLHQSHETIYAGFELAFRSAHVALAPVSSAAANIERYMQHFDVPRGIPEERIRLVKAAVSYNLLLFLVSNTLAFLVSVSELGAVPTRVRRRIVTAYHHWEFPIVVATLSFVGFVATMLSGGIYESQMGLAPTRNDLDFCFVSVAMTGGTSCLLAYIVVLFSNVRLLRRTARRREPSFARNLRRHRKNLPSPFPPDQP